MIMEEREYVPYDLSSEEDRKALRNKWVSAEGEEYPIGAIGQRRVMVNRIWITPQTLLKCYTDAVTGEPCGKSIEFRRNE